jgi:hypothetical protein
MLAKLVYEMSQSQVTPDAWKSCKLPDLKTAYTVYFKKIPDQKALTTKKDILLVLQTEFERRKLLDEDERDVGNELEENTDEGEDIVQLTDITLP